MLRLRSAQATFTRTTHTSTPLSTCNLHTHHSCFDSAQHKQPSHAPLMLRFRSAQATFTRTTHNQLISLQHIDLLSLQPHLKHTKDATGSAVVFDPVRRKNVRATPEEIVRQLWIIYFLETLRLNPKLIAVERAFVINGMLRRFDLVLFDKTTLPVLLAEFKAPGILLHQSTFDQIAQYNMELHVPLALVSNGSIHYCFRIDDERRGFEFLSDLPLNPLKGT